MTRAEEKAIDAWAIYEYREHQKGLYHTCFVDGYQQGYEQAEKDILSKITPEHIAGLKWIGNAGISSQPYPYHKYCKDLLKILEELLNNE